MSSTAASKQSLIASLNAEEQREVRENSFPDRKSKKMAVYGWRYHARGGQRPPADTDWIVWLLLAGRGFGKTRTGAEMILAEVRAERAKRIALIGPTAADVRDVMVEGESGILSVAPPDSRPVYQVSKRRLVWANGAIAFCYSADEPRRLRGPQHDLAWLRIRIEPGQRGEDGAADDADGSGTGKKDFEDGITIQHFDALPRLTARPLIKE